MANDEMREIIDSFISEAHDLIEDVSVILPKVENTQDAEQRSEFVNTIFRLFHTLKATSGYLNFKSVNLLAHTAETYLDFFRKNENLAVTVEDMDIVYKSCDMLTQLVRQVDENGDDTGLENELEILVQNLNEVIKKNESRSLELEMEEKGEIEIGLDKVLDDIAGKENLDKFIAETEDFLDLIEETALLLEKNPDDKALMNEIFRNIHTIKGNAGFLGESRIEEKCIQCENFLTDILEHRNHSPSTRANEILKYIDTLRKVLSEKTVFIPEAIEYKPLGELLIEMGLTDRKNIEEALNTQGKPLGEILVERGLIDQSDVEKALEKQKLLLQRKESAAPILTHKRSIRVDSIKVDKLFNLVGELIIAEAMVVNNTNVRKLGDNAFNKSSELLTKITGELQEVSMSLRMLPLEGLFNKMTRLVRDLSRKSGKHINFQIIGQETEMDKSIIEDLADPLVHIIRNAIDHGLESDEERKNKGKKEVGILELKAKYEGNEVWISVKDDGRGLNREKILAKAKSQNLLSENENTLSDSEVWEFIIEPGFSTAEKVTDLSGRGVGMDVVKKNIEQLKGKIDMDSSPDNGTTITLKIPLTMAIIDGIVCRVGKNYYAVPVEDILEFFVPSEEQIVTLSDGNELIKMRDETVRVIKIAETFNLSSGAKNYQEGIIVVVIYNNVKIALLIDEVIGGQQLVIKALPAFMGTIPGLKGCSILGNGDVSFIIDIGGLVKKEKIDKKSKNLVYA